MKNLLHLFSIIVLFSVSSCNTDDDEIPACLQSRIDAFGQEICNSGANVKLFTFQGDDVYVIFPGTCGADLSDEVLDEDCNTLGWLGGFAGGTDINGEDFYANATLESTVWSN